LNRRFHRVALGKRQKRKKNRIKVREEEERRKTLSLLEQAAPVSPVNTPEDDRPLSAMFAEIWADMPDEVLAKLPGDGADQHDHYIYGTTKRAL
jgi:hypothetical protein